MKYLTLLAIPILLAACSPAGSPVEFPPVETPRIVIVTSAPLPTSAYDILPVEAQRVIDRATASAAAVATQAALATQAEGAARSTSTTAARLTADSLVVAQTQSALQLTAGAGAAAATNAAAIRTAEADQTAAAATPTALALAASVRGTATAVARLEAQAVANQERDQVIATARGWLLLGLLGLFLLALGAALVFGLSDLLSARADMLRAQAARANAEAMQMWIMQYHGVLLQLRGSEWQVMQQPQLPPPAPLADPEPPVIREVPVRAHGEVVSTIRMDEPETPERQRVLHLLMQAVAIAGPGAGAIPSAVALGMHPQDWQTAVDHLKASADRPGYVITSPGRPKAGQIGRTRLIAPDYKTLGALLDGVKRGDAIPRPAPPRPAAGPGNVHNVISE